MNENATEHIAREKNAMNGRGRVAGGRVGHLIIIIIADCERDGADWVVDFDIALLYSAYSVFESIEDTAA